jgi:hypothetical protein
MEANVNPAFIFLGSAAYLIVPIMAWILDEDVRTEPIFYKYHAAGWLGYTAFLAIVYWAIT